MPDDDFDYEARADNVLAFIKDSKNLSIQDHELGEALYSFSENGLWPDYVDSVSIEQAKMIINLYHAIEANDGKFPTELKM